MSVAFEFPQKHPYYRPDQTGPPAPRLAAEPVCVRAKTGFEPQPCLALKRTDRFPRAGCRPMERPLDLERYRLDDIQTARGGKPRGYPRYLNRLTTMPCNVRRSCSVRAMRWNMLQMLRIMAGGFLTAVLIPAPKPSSGRSEQPLRADSDPVPVRVGEPVHNRENQRLSLPHLWSVASKYRSDRKY